VNASTHRAEAETLMKKASESKQHDWRTYLVAQAQVHATLALEDRVAEVLSLLDGGDKP
jgi:hypothetical protein